MMSLFDDPWFASGELATLYGEEKAGRARAIRDRARQFCKEEAPSWGEQIERDGKIPEALWQRMTELGFHKLTLPEWAGGEGLPLALYFPILEEIAHGHGAIRMVFHAYNSIWRTLEKGSSEQQKYWFPRLVKEGRSAAFALTEPDYGTGIDLHTMASEQDGHFVLNGRKHLITFAEESAFITVIAKMEGAAGRGALTAFLLTKDHPGLELENMAPMMGDIGCTHAILTFKDCRVTKDEVIGGVGNGYDVALHAFLDQSRAGIATSMVGLSQEALNAALEQVQNRKTFGKALVSRQAVQMKLAEMQIAVQSARLLCMDAAKKYDQGEDISVEASMAKAHAISASQRVTDDALNLFGGIGYSKTSPVERLYRDARSLWFEEGTSDMQKMTVAEALITHARRQKRRARHRAHSGAGE
ncbi:acyl-CoA dehydrogenase [Sporolactobacillus sp. THM7-7]|nr:acyl-CoA dehydrogenase [Sporolactobacillus sp. THM7-7]